MSSEQQLSKEQTENLRLVANTIGANLGLVALGLEMSVNEHVVAWRSVDDIRKSLQFRFGDSQAFGYNRVNNDLITFERRRLVLEGRASGSYSPPQVYILRPSFRQAVSAYCGMVADWGITHAYCDLQTILGRQTQKTWDRFGLLSKVAEAQDGFSPNEDPRQRASLNYLIQHSPLLNKHVGGDRLVRYTLSSEYERPVTALVTAFNGLRQLEGWAAHQARAREVYASSDELAILLPGIHIQIEAAKARRAKRRQIPLTLHRY